MKNYLHITILVLTILSCRDNSRKEPVNLNNEMVTINNPQLIDSLRKYQEQNLTKERGGVIVVNFQLENDTSVFYVTSSMDKSLVTSNPPGYFSVVDEFPVLFYTGIEKNLTFDSLYLSDLNKLINPFLEEYLEDEKGDILQVPPNYNPVTWKIEMVNEKVIKSEVLN